MCASRVQRSASKLVRFVTRAKGVLGVLYRVNYFVYEFLIYHVRFYGIVARNGGPIYSVYGLLLTSFLFHPLLVTGFYGLFYLFLYRTPRVIRAIFFCISSVISNACRINTT